jgi:hypothetical protein
VQKEERISDCSFGSAIHLNASSWQALQNDAALSIGYLDGIVGASAIDDDDFLLTVLVGNSA